jgi:MFS family permease
MNPSVDVSQPEYYYKFIIFSFILFGIIQLFIWAFTQDETDFKSVDKLLDNEFITQQNSEIIKRGKILKFKYMSAYLLSKAAMWAKAPYTFILFSSLYNFNFGQIGVLYIIDAICSLFSGPLIGIMADTFGRKIVAIYYPINTVVIIIMRLSGIVPVAYAAQILTGFAANVLSTSFEAWLNYEINKIYKDNPSHVQAFRKEIFSKISYYDSILSLLTAIAGATIYVCRLYKLILFHI